MKKLRQVLTTWSIVYLMITVLIYGLNEWLIQQPIYVRTLVLSAVMVFGLQYVILPAIEKIKSSFNH